MDEKSSKPKVSKKQQACVTRYVKANYDRIGITLPKGKKEAVKAKADSNGETVNGYICRLIDDDLKA